MSLETLLEAAEFLEWRNNPKTREETSPVDTYSGYATASANDSDGSPDSSISGKNSGNEDAKEKRRPGGAGTREVHNKLEKNRRAHLKECFEFLKNQIPTLEDKRASNLGILRGSLRYIQALRRKEKEYEMEMQRLAKEKITLQERISNLKQELARMNIEVDLNQWMIIPEEQDSNSTSTATEQGSPICSDDEEDELLLKNKNKQTYTVQTVNESKKLALPPASYQLLGLAPNGIQAKMPISTTPKNNNSVVNMMPVSTPVLQQALKTVPPTLPPAVPSASVTVKPPVTQILAQTLSQRQLQKRVNRSQLGPNLLKSLHQMRHPFVMNSFPSAMPTPTAVTHLAQIMTAGQIASTGLSNPGGGVTMNPSLPAAAASNHNHLSTLTKALGSQPILVTPGLHIATTPVSSSAAPVTTITTSTFTVSTTTPTLFTFDGLRPASSTAATISKAFPLPNAVSGAPAMITAGTIQNVKPAVVGSAGNTHYLTGQLPATILAQAIPRTNIPVGSTPTSVVGGQPTSMQQLMAFANMTPGTQLVSPVMMTPGVPLATAGWSQGQVNNVLGQPFLKQIPYPLPNFQVLKPFVVVTVPTVVTTTPPATSTVVSPAATSAK